MDRPDIQRWAAFSSDPSGGNPAGVVLDAGGLDEARMLQIAADLGYAETAFVITAGDGSRHIRYFSPLAEVPFCGHATVATAAAIADTAGDGDLLFVTPVGEVEVTVRTNGGIPTVSFTSVEPEVAALPPETLDSILRLLGLKTDDLDPRYPAELAFGGNWHPLIVIRDRATFDGFAFDPVAARALMDAEGWPATLIVLWHQEGDRWQARNVFPVGSVTEDPATGAAAAATGGYLRVAGVVPQSGRIVIEQGRHVGRPSELTVNIPPRGGIVVSGTAVRIG